MVPIIKCDMPHSSDIRAALYEVVHSYIRGSFYWYGTGKHPAIGTEEVCPTVVSIFLLISLSFSGYYQFLHFPTTHGINERWLEDSTYAAGGWMENHVTGSAISNDRGFGNRIAATSDTTHHLVMYTLHTSAYGFFTVNLSEFKWYPITSEEFWFDVGTPERDWGEYYWEAINELQIPAGRFNITCFAENTKAGGNVIWHHGRYPSKLLHLAYDENGCVYDCGKVRVWELV